MKLLLAVLLLADAWSSALGGDRDAAVKALGPPQKEFIGSLPDDAFPVQLVDAVVESDKPRRAVRVLQWKGPIRTFSYQLVLHDGKAVYAIAPPLADERDVAAVTKKHGKVEPAVETIAYGDLLRSWEVLAYEKVLYVKKPGETTILARVLLPQR